MPRTRATLLGTAVLLLSSAFLLSCSSTSTSPSDPYAGYTIRFENPPTSGPVGLTLFDVRLGTPADVDSVQDAMQDSVSTQPPNYTKSAFNDPVLGLVRLGYSFTFPGTKRISAKAYFKHNVTRTAQIYYHVQ